MLTGKFIAAGENNDVFTVVGVSVHYIRIGVIFGVGGEKAHLLIAYLHIAFGHGNAGMFVITDLIGIKEYLVRRLFCRPCILFRGSRHRSGLAFVFRAGWRGLRKKYHRAEKDRQQSPSAFHQRSLHVIVPPSVSRHSPLFVS